MVSHEELPRSASASNSFLRRLIPKNQKFSKKSGKIVNFKAQFDGLTRKIGSIILEKVNI